MLGFWKKIIGEESAEEKLEETPESAEQSEALLAAAVVAPPETAEKKSIFSQPADTGRIITLCNQKGGTGKTTSAVNLGAYLASLGKKVLLVDLDSQANASSALSASPKQTSPTIYHALMGGIHPAGIVKETPIKNYFLLPSSPDLAGATVELVSQKDREFRLRNVLQPLKNSYDFILIDCPPSLGLLTINGLVAADEIIIPVQSEYYAMEGLGQLLETIGLIRDNLHRDIPIMGAVLTMYDKRSHLCRFVADELYHNFPGFVFKSIIPRSIRLAEAPGKGKTILEFDPKSIGAKAYKELAQEVIERASIS